MRTLAHFSLVLLFTLVGCDDDGSPGGETERDGATGTDAGPGADTAPPQAATVAITSPADGAQLPARTVMVAGTVTGADQVDVNGTAAQVEGDNWTAEVRLEAGPNTITATAGAATDSVMINIDQVPPRIDITSPERGTWQAEGQLDLAFTASDENGLNTVTRNELDVDPSQGPDFVLNGIPLERGLNLMRLQATDPAGNIAREHVSILQGELSDPANGVEGAVRMHIGNAGFDALERLALRLLEEQDLSELVPPDALPNFDPFAITVEGLNYRRPAVLELTPMAERLAFRLRLEELVITIGLVIGDRPPVPLNVGNEFVEVTGFIVLDAVDGQITVEIEELMSLFGDFQFNLNDVPEFEDNPDEGEGLLTELADAVVEVLAGQLVSDLVADQLSGLDLSFELDLLGAQLTVSLVPAVIVTSDRGLSVLIDGFVELANPAADVRLDGYVGSPTGWNGAPQTDQIGLAVDDDFLNLLLYQVWASGVLLPTLDQDLLEDAGSELRVVFSLLGTTLGNVYPDVSPNTPMVVETELPLPIYVGVNKGADGVGLALGIGDLALTVNTAEAEPRHLMDGAASIIVRGELGVEPTTVTEEDENGQEVERDALGLTFMTTGSEAHFDVTNEELRGAVENTVEEPMVTLLDAVGDILPGLISGFALPSLDFITIGELNVGAAEADPNFIEITVILAE